MIAGGVAFRAACLASIVLTPAAIGSAAAPLPAAPRYADLPQPLPLPYVARDAEPALAAARARAMQSGKRLLIDVGANWCFNCRLLGGLMRAPRVAAFLNAHFEVVTVDIGHFDRNMAVLGRLGFTGRRLFVPAVVVIDPRAHRIVNRGDEMRLADTAAIAPSDVLATLARWSR